MAEFINPYTFVPLPVTIKRAKPTGHAKAGDKHLCGQLTVTWTLRTPLLLPKSHPHVDGGTVIVPGSSVKGALRSLHETLMGGCLRAVDADFVPVYREPAVTRPASWRLAVVETATRDGRAEMVRLTSRTVWVEESAFPSPPTTGDRITVPAAAITRTNLGRDEVSGGSAVTVGGQWVVLVGDAGARGNAHRFFIAAGLIDGSSTAVRTVTTDAWDDYLRLCDRSNDVMTDRRDGGGPRFATVNWNGHKVGKRRRVTGRLRPGDAVWVEIGPDDTVVHLAMAAIWRRSGVGPVRERVPAAVLGCTDWQHLCLSCRLFGSAPVTTGPRGEADQRAYAGHVRVGDAVARRVHTETEPRLAPLGAPRPGAGQFYLKIADTTPATQDTELPAAAWGSAQDWEKPEDPDEPERPRRLRGRKYYWHGDPRTQQPPRHRARAAQQNAQMIDERELVPAGTVFTQTITFDNLAPAEVGSLLLTLLPGLMLPRTEGRAAEETRYALRLGGGKPLGLGSAEVEVTDLRWWDAADRYRGQKVQCPSAAEFFQPVRHLVAELAGAARKQWPTLSRILRVDGVENPELIWYPLGGEWNDDRNRDRSFTFFRSTNGRPLKRNPEPIVPLPDPDPAQNDNQRLSAILRGRR